jgi:hypothetical protein
MTDRMTKTGPTLTQAERDAIAEEVESTDFDIECLEARRRGSLTTFHSLP